MEIKALKLLGKKPRHPLAVCSLEDFEFSEGPAVDAKQIITNPKVSLYCLDLEGQRAIFVETSPEIDLSRSPFYYQAQHESARGLYAVPFEVFLRLAEDLSLESERLILTYSVGRCGSTLLSRVMNQIPDLVGFSEPAVYTQLAALYQWDGSNSAEVIKLLNAATRFLCKPNGAANSKNIWAIKFRSFDIEIAHLMHQNFKNSKNVFLYRNAETWLESFHRAFAEGGEASPETQAELFSWLMRLVPSLVQHLNAGGPPPSTNQVGILMWLSVMERYFDLQQNGIPMFALRYEDLTTQPEACIKALLEFCEIPNFDMDQALLPFDSDSQAGTPLSRDRLGIKQGKLPAEIIAEIDQILSQRPVIQSADFVVPNTYHSKVG